MTPGSISFTVGRTLHSHNVTHCDKAADFNPTVTSLLSNQRTIKVPEVGGVKECH